MGLYMLILQNEETGSESVEGIYSTLEDAKEVQRALYPGETTTIEEAPLNAGLEEARAGLKPFRVFFGMFGGVYSSCLSIHRPDEAVSSDYGWVADVWAASEDEAQSKALEIVKAEKMKGGKQ